MYQLHNLGSRNEGRKEKKEKRERKSGKDERKSKRNCAKDRNVGIEGKERICTVSPALSK
jgi:hypothetical protein